MIDHIGFAVADFVRSTAFYAQALDPLHISLQMSWTDEAAGKRHAGFGREGKPFFWIGEGDRLGMTHVAFTAGSWADVDAFHAAALAAGGRDNGSPGPRPHYHPHYYGAFVLDPDDNNIEAVCHKPAA